MGTHGGGGMFRILPPVLIPITVIGPHSQFPIPLGDSDPCGFLQKNQKNIKKILLNLIKYP